RTYAQGHIPGAWFAIRSRLALAMEKIEPRGTLVLTSEDGMLAALALDEMAALTKRPVRYLAGGNAAWTASGRALTAGAPRLADEALDVWLKPYERASGVQSAMQEYLSWEVDLLDRIKRDGTTHFRPLVPYRGGVGKGAWHLREAPCPRGGPAPWILLRGEAGQRGHGL